MKYATLTVSLLIIIAVLTPGRSLPDVNIGGYDKLIHLGMFAVWAVAVRYDFNIKPFPYLRVFIAGLLFSVLTEVLQILIEGRNYDPYDMAADAAGVVIGLLMGGWIVKWAKRIIKMQ